MMNSAKGKVRVAAVTVMGAVAFALLAIVSISVVRAGSNAIWPVFGNTNLHNGQSTNSTAANTGDTSCGVAPCTPNTKWTVGPSSINFGAPLDQFTNPVIDTNALIYEVTDPGEIFQVGDSGSSGGVNWGPISPTGSLGGACTGAGTPLACCTDVGLGTCDSYDSPSLSNDSNTLYVIDQSTTGAGTACAGGPPCHGTLFALNTVDGSNKWSFDITINGSGAGQADRSGPVVGADGTIYYGSTDGYLTAVTDNGSSASQKWTVNLGVGSRTNDTPAIDAAGKIYIGDDSGHLFRVTDNGSSGNLDWTATFTHPAADTGQCSVPSIDTTNHVVYVGTSNGNLWSVTYSDSDNTTHTDLRVLLGTNGAVHPNYATAAIKAGGGTIYDPTFTAASPGQGVMRKVTVTGCPGACVFTSSWRFPASGTAGTIKSSPQISSDGTVYYGDEASNVHALTDNGASASENTNYPFKNTLTVATTSFDSSVAIQSDGTIYAGNSSDLFFPINSNASLPFTPTATISPTVTVTPTATSTATATATPTATATATSSTTATLSPTSTATQTATITATTTATTTATPTTTATLSPTTTATQTVTTTATATTTATLSPTTTATATVTTTTTATPTITATQTATSTATLTATITATPTTTATQTATTTATLTATITATPTTTATQTATTTQTTTSTATLTSTPTATSTPAGTPTTTVSISPASCDSGSVVEGNTSTICVIRVNNTGFTNHLIVTNITIDDALDFGVFFTDCQAPGGTPAQSGCSINVAFVPQSLGPYTTHMHVFDNATSSPQSVTLTGTGTLPPPTTDSIVPNPLDFGGSAVGQPNEQFLTVNNTGFTNPLVLQTLTLTDTTPGYTGPNEFTLVPGDSTCPATPAGLGPGGTCVLAFNLTADASHVDTSITGTLVITGNATTSPQTINLTGYGVSGITPDGDCYTASDGSCDATQGSAGFSGQSCLVDAGTCTTGAGPSCTCQ